MARRFSHQASTVDDKGKLFGCKSTTLESIGLLIPFIAFPKKVRGKHLVFMVDNTAVSYGWEKGAIKCDNTATEILKSVHFLSAHLGSTVHVEHVPRMSNSIAELADELSRKELSAYSNHAHYLSNATEVKVVGHLLNWLKEPKKGGLCHPLLMELKNKLAS